MDVRSLLIIAVGAIFINNFVLMRFLGICPYIGVSKSLDSAIGMGSAVIFVMTLASVVTFLVEKYILVPDSSVFRLLLAGHGAPDLRFLRTIAYILTIASLVQFVEMVIQKSSPALYKSLGIYLPLITTNCAVLGVALLNQVEHFNFIQSAVNGFSAGVGFTLALVLMSSIREKLELADVPPALRGVPIAFIMAGLMSIAFLGFSGLALK